MAWFRRQKDESTSVPEAPVEASVGAGETEPDDGVIRQERSATGDWMTMPAMATAGPIQPTFRVQTLPEILTSHHSPRVSSSLGHAISADGPSGVASGLAQQAGSTRAATGVATDLTLRAPHLPSPVEEFAPLSRPLPTVSAEPLPIARLPEPAISHTLSNAMPLAAPAPGVRDLPVARVVDVPVAAAPSVPPATSSSGESSEGSGAVPPAEAASSPYATDGPRVGGFDLSALDAPVDDANPELLASRPDDLAPPIQPRTLQRRTVGARPIEVPPHLLAPSTPPVSATGAPALDLPLRESRRASTLDEGNAGNPSIGETASVATSAASATNEADSGDSAGTSSSDAVDSDVGSPEQGSPAVQRLADTGSPSAPSAAAPLLDGLSPMATGATADRGTSQSVVEEAASNGLTAGALDLPLHAASPLDASSPSSAVGPGTAGSALVQPAPAPVQRQSTDSSSTSTAPLAGSRPLGVEPGPVDPRGAEAAGPRPSAGVSPLPLVAPRPANVPVAPSTVSVSRSADASAPNPGATSPLSSPADGSAADEDRSGTTSATSGPTATAPQDAAAASTFDEDPVPTLGAVPTSVQTAPLTSTGASTNDQIGPSPSALPLAPSDWQETLDAPRSEQMSGGTAYSAAGASPSFPLAATRAVGASSPLSSFTSLAPTTTSPLQRQAAANAAPTATVQTLARALPTASSATGGAPAVLRTPQPELPPLVTSSNLLDAPFRTPLPKGASAATDPSATPPDAPFGADAAGGARSESLPLQRSASGFAPAMAASNGSGRSDAMPLHTPAASMPSAADIVVSAGLAERGPDGTLLYPQPPTGASSVQRSVEVGIPDEPIAAPAMAPELSVSRALEPSAPAAENSGTLQDRTAGLAEQARKLYPHIRSQLESDIRKQLEARNRANRFRA